MYGLEEKIIKITSIASQISFNYAKIIKYHFHNKH